jgi:hypothetical protein
LSSGLLTHHNVGKLLRPLNLHKGDAVKNLLAMTMLFSLAMSVGCRPAGEDEAVKRAKECWKITDLGGATYLCAITTEPNPSKTVFELRDIQMKVGLGPTSDVQKLNGVEYDGIVNLVAAACRRGQPHKTWSEWSAASGSTHEDRRGGCVDALRVRKVHGKWEVVQYHHSGQSFYCVPENATFKQVEASDLPK